MRFDRGRALLAFGLAVLAFHHLPTIDVWNIGIVIDLWTPLAVVGTAALLVLTGGADRIALLVAFLAALAYVDGHGIHLAANAIHEAEPTGEAGERAEFWDEVFGHIEWHLGWFGLILAACLAERARPGFAASRLVTAAAVGALGFTLFTSTVDGQTWPLMLAAGALVAGWALVERRPLLMRCGAAFALAAVLVGVWAIWQGGVPEFSDVWEV